MKRRMFHHSLRAAYDRLRARRWHRFVTLFTSGLLALMLAGCADKARRVKDVDFSKVKVQHAEAAGRLANAKGHSKTASEEIDRTRGHVGRARQGLGYQAKALEAVKPHVETLMQNVPAELRPEVEAVRVQVTALETLAADIAQAAADAEAGAAKALAAQGHVNTDLAFATAAVTQAQADSAEAQGLAAQVVAEANRNADLADKAQLGEAKAQKRAVIAWGVAGVCLLGCAVLGYILLKP